MFYAFVRAGSITMAWRSMEVPFPSMTLLPCNFAKKKQLKSAVTSIVVGESPRKFVAFIAWVIRVDVCSYKPWGHCFGWIWGGPIVDAAAIVWIAIADRHFSKQILIIICAG